MKRNEISLKEYVLNKDTFQETQKQRKERELEILAARIARLEERVAKFGRAA